MVYILYITVFIITVLILYGINLLFKPETNIHKPKNNKPKININSDCIIVLSYEHCPYCKTLEDQIVDSKNKRTIITLMNNGSFKFDDVYTDLDINERESIIEGVKKIFQMGTVNFPVILYKTKVINGLPEQEQIKEIFN